MNTVLRLKDVSQLKQQGSENDCTGVDYTFKSFIPLNLHVVTLRVHCHPFSVFWGILHLSSLGRLWLETFPRWRNGTVGPKQRGNTTNKPFPTKPPDRKPRPMQFLLDSRHWAGFCHAHRGRAAQRQTIAT